MTDEPDDLLADLFPGTQDADLPEYEYWGPLGYAVRGRLLPPTPKQPQGNTTTAPPMR